MLPGGPPRGIHPQYLQGLPMGGPWLQGTSSGRPPRGWWRGGHEPFRAPNENINTSQGSNFTPSWLNFSDGGKNKNKYSLKNKKSKKAQNKIKLKYKHSLRRNAKKRKTTKKKRRSKSAYNSNPIKKKKEKTREKKREKR
jgi:hypothetical protein